jgi:1-deoxy-D-xylulose-5-phosphate reductoisomerase
VSERRDIVILGSTGSVGTQALDVVRANPDRFRVVGLTAGGSQQQLFEEQLAEFAPAYSGLGEDASTEAAGLACDVVLNAVTGAVGLRPTVAALQSGNTLALANKESLIIGGAVVTAMAKPGQIVPVDSEHSALAQCLRGGRPAEVHRLVLTASGGPFRGRTRPELTRVTPEEALNHPTWAMGPVVTINSATLVNKGLEVIEAHLLFDIPFDRIEVVVHPTSVVHSMVEFTDGSTLAQASPPTMLIPIALGLSWPDRVPGVAPAVDWTTAQSWEFFPLDDEAFPAVRLARQAGEQGGTAPAVYNAANEVCVEAFRTGDLAFVDIVDTVGLLLRRHRLEGHRLESHRPEGRDVGSRRDLTVDDVLAADAWARAQTLDELKRAQR